MLLNPQWLWIIPFLSLYIVYHRRRGSAISFSLRPVMLLLAVLFTVVTLSRPVLPQKPLDMEQEGSDVIFAVDISYSMQATDIAPTRLEAARKVLEEAVTADRHNRFGVLAFTTNPIILSPLTRDDELLLHLFSGLDTSLVVTHGTSMEGVLKLARKMSSAPHPIVVLLSDGGDAADYSRKAEWAKSNGLIIDVVLLATPGGTTLKESDGRMLRDEAGNIVVTARNDAVEVLAERTGGTVIYGADVSALLSAIERQGRDDVGNRTKVNIYHELFYYPLWLALLFAMLGMTDLNRRLTDYFKGFRRA